VPGGVGPLTVAMLLENVVDAATKYFNKQKARLIKPLPLKIKSPPPSDIAISRAQHPKLITVVAKEVGIAEHELEPYGAYKSKVDLSLLKRLQHRRDGRYVVVTGITPTPLGEGRLFPSTFSFFDFNSESRQINNNHWLDSGAGGSPKSSCLCERPTA